MLDIKLVDLHLELCNGVFLGLKLNFELTSQLLSDGNLHLGHHSFLLFSICLELSVFLEMDIDLLVLLFILGVQGVDVSSSFFLLVLSLLLLHLD